jgi:hypothetical protein
VNIVDLPNSRILTLSAWHSLRQPKTPRSKSIRNLPQQILWLSALQNYIEVEWHRQR